MFEVVPIDNPEGLNFILGQSFGLAFSEASGDCLIRTDGTDPSLVDLATRNAHRINCGHTFIIFLKNAFPVSVLNAVKSVPEVCRVFCATANPCCVVVAVCDHLNPQQQMVRQVQEEVESARSGGEGSGAGEEVPMKPLVAATTSGKLSIGRGIMGVVDGFVSKGVEDDAKKAERLEFLRKIGYKRG
ncbi:hypothetical protein HK102_002902 [Quaeritorhiza haematococci]|nr:hypothetical protein HK102_002902 [Quaeritorhiza haematococci]